MALRHDPQSVPAPHDSPMASTLSTPSRSSARIFEHATPLHTHTIIAETSATLSKV